MQFGIVFVGIIQLALLAGVGFVAGKTRYLPEDAGVILSRVVIKLTAPILIVTHLTSHTMEDTSELSRGVVIYLLGLAFLLYAYFMSRVVSKVLKLEGAVANVYKMQSMFGNVIFLAFPLLELIYPEKGIVYALFFNLANDTVLWTLGIYLVNKHNTTRWKDNLKHLINGNTIAFTIGILFIVFNLQGLIASNPYSQQVYSFIYATFYPLGKTTIYLSMIFIGLILAGVNWREKLEGKNRLALLLLAFFKLLLIPLTAFLVLFIFGKGLDPFVKTIVVIQLSMPCATIVPALASQYESDYKFATQGVFVSTVLGMVSLPFMVYLTQWLR